MNKLILSDEEIKFEEKDGLVEMVNKKLNNIFKINLVITGDTDLKIEHKIKSESKLDITFELNSGITLNVLDFKQGTNLKIKQEYLLNKASVLNVIKFYDCEKVKELDLINLNGEYAEVSYHLKTISKQKQSFDFMVYHNASNTKSNIIHNGANILDGNLSFNLTGVVYKNVLDCILEQNSRIVTFNEHKCNINPNLLIEENDVIANHSALIGKFSDEELFYLMSRGIKKEKALNLLVKGFLLDKIDDEEIIKIIDKYWR